MPRCAASATLPKIVNETGSAVSDRNMELNSEKDENTERGSESREHSEQTRLPKLRDLRPEKDPMGAGKDGALLPGRAEQ